MSPPPDLNSFGKLPRRLWLRAAGYAGVCFLLAEAATIVGELWGHGVGSMGVIPPEIMASIRTDTLVNIMLSLVVFGSLMLMARQQEDALAERMRAETRFRHLVEAASDTILVLDAQGMVQYASAASTELLGFRPAELPGKRFQSLISSAGAAQAEQLLKGLQAQSGAMQRGMLTFISRAGEPRLVDVQGRNLMADEAIGGLVLHCRDITAQQRAAQQRAQAEERLTMALEAGRMGVFEWDLRNGEVHGNATLRTMMGSEIPCPCRIDDFLLHIAVADREALAAAMATARARAGALEHEFTVGGTEGGGRVLQMHAQFRTDPRSAEVTRLIGVVRDVTERREMLQRLGRFAAFPMLDPNPVMEFDGQGTVTLQNDAAKEACAQAAGAAGDFLPPNFSDLVARVADGAAVRHAYQLVIAGRVFAGLLAASPKVPSFRCYLTDITDRARAEEELQLRAAMLANVSEAISLWRAADLTVLEGNPQFERLFGLEPGGLIGQPAARLLLPDPRLGEQILTDIAAELAHDRSWDGELECQRRDGTRFWARTAIIKFNHPEKGEVWVVSQADITDRKLAEAEMLFRSRLDMALLELPAVAERLSEPELMLHGLEQAERLTGSTMAFLRLPPAGAQDMEVTLASRQAEGQFGPWEAFCRAHPETSSGLWVEAFRLLRPAVVNDYAAHRAEQGLPVTAPALARFLTVPVLENGRVLLLLCMVNKPTAYAEREVQSVQLIGDSLARLLLRRRAAAQLQKFVSAVEQSGVSVVITDPQGVIEYVNPWLTELTGYTLAEVRGRTPRIFKSEQTSRATHDELWRTVTQGHVWRGEFTNRKKNGELHVEECVISAVKDAHGKITHFVAVKTDVTERRRIQTEQQRVEQRFAAALASATDGFWLVDAHGRIMEANPAYARMSGYSPEELRTMSVADLELRESAEEVAVHLERIVQQGHDRFLSKHRRRDGSAYPVEVSAVYSPENGGQFAAFIRDITKRLATEATLRDNAVQLRSLGDNLPNGMIYQLRTSPDGQRRQFLYVSAGVQGLHEVSAAEVLQDAAIFTRQTHPEDLPTVRRLEAEALAEMKPLRMECRLMLPSGKIRWSLVTSAPRRLEDGDLIWDGLEMDITDFKTAEQQLSLQSTALAAAANVIIITDTQGRMQWVNEAFTRTTGYTSTEALGQNPRMLKSGSHPPEFYANLWATIVAGRVWHGELCNRRKDGTIVEEETTITPVRDPGGQITHYIAIKQDITERKQLERLYLRAQRMESVGMLAGGIAHDLNNVLTPIIMGLELLKQMPLPPQIAPVIESMLNSTQRGAGIVKQVLTFARGTEGERSLVQIRHLVKDIIQMARETFPRNITLRSTCPADLWPLLADPSQMHQVLLNLGVNARDAMPLGGQLTFDAHNVTLDDAAAQKFAGGKPGDYVCLKVTDTGTGMAPETVDRIFEPFFTTKPAGQGTGLGLPTVLGIVRSHGGFLNVESQLGRGTTFAVFLPASRSAVGGAAGADFSAPPRGNGETILLVDDEPAVLTVATSMLEASGYQVQQATDGASAVAAYVQGKTRISLVITDIMMPLMDGVALIQALRRVNPAVPIITVSGLAGQPGQPSRLAEIQALGIRHHLGKPYSTEALLEAIHAELHPTG